VIIIALLIAVSFYYFRSIVPLWLALGHVPVGVLLVGVGMYGMGSDVGVIAAAVYVMSSTYAYHFFTPLAGVALILFSAVVFGFVARLLGIEGWLSLSVKKLLLQRVRGAQRLFAARARLPQLSLERK